MPEDQRLQQGAISESSMDDASVRAKIQDFVDNERFRKHIISIIDEHTDGTAFMKKVRTSLADELDSTYTSKKFEQFQTKVQEIGLAQLGTDTAHDALKPYIDGRVDKVVSDRFWKNKTFWIPTIIAAASVVVAYFRP